VSAAQASGLTRRQGGARRGEATEQTLFGAVLQWVPGGQTELILTIITLLIADLAVLWSVETALSGGERSAPRLLVSFIGGGLLASFELRRLLTRASEATNKALSELVRRVLLGVDKLDLRGMERLGVDRVHRLITLESPLVAQAGLPIAAATRYATRAGAATIYLLVIAPQIAAFTVLILGLVGALRYSGWTLAAQGLEACRVWRGRLTATMVALSRGITQVLLHRPRGDALIDETRAMSEGLGEQQRQVGRIALQNEAVAGVLLYGLIALIATALGAFDAVLAAKVLIVVFFVLRAINQLINHLSTLERASVAYQGLRALEAEVVTAVQTRRIAPAWPPIDAFQSIGLREVTFVYDAADGYTFGPVDLTVRRGEVLFITGPNGSGKSTALKLFLGLYPPLGGSLLLNGAPIPSPAPQAWRDLFSVVLSDFVLFERLLGLDVPAERANELLRWLGLDEKVQVENGRFSTLELSTGQRKRLAMVVALLQDREVFVFDEWAADQDPEFREAYYHRILPDLKRRGKTVICVTHDDQFFHLADRRVIIEGGRVRP
jgi:putative ATP-binding cassette transporter